MSEQEKAEEGTAEELVQYFRDHNARVLRAHNELLKEYAESCGIDIREPGWRERAAIARQADIERGLEVLAGARKAGQQKRGKRKGPPDEVLQAEVREILAAEANNPNMSDTRACRHVAQRHGLSTETVLRRTRGHRRP